MPSPDPEVPSAGSRNLLVLSFNLVPGGTHSRILESFALGGHWNRILVLAGGVSDFAPVNVEVLRTTSAAAANADYDLRDLPAGCALLPERVYEQLKPIEGETLRMMDRLVRRRKGNPFGLTFDSRRTNFLDHCQYWYNLLCGHSITHTFLSDIPHSPPTFVAHRMASVLGVETLIAFHEKSGTATRSQNALSKGSGRPPSSLDHDVFYLTRSMETLRMGSFLRPVSQLTNGCARIPQGSPVSSSDGDPPVRPSSSNLCLSLTTSRQWIKRHRLNWQRRRKYGLAPFLGALLASCELRRWDSFLHRHGEVPSPSEIFCVYFLSFQPEASTSPRAGLYVEQERAISLCASALSPTMSVYVKEHPDQFSRRRPRTSSLLRSLRKRQGFHLLHPRVSAEWCLAHASVIASPPGSVTLRAWRQGIPVIQFGSGLYRNAPGVYGEEDLFGVLSGTTDVPRRHTLTQEEVISRAQFAEWLNGLGTPGGSLSGIRRSRQSSEALVCNLTAEIDQWVLGQLVEERMPAAVSERS